MMMSSEGGGGEGGEKTDPKVLRIHQGEKIIPPHTRPSIRRGYRNMVSWYLEVEDSP